MYRWLSSSRQLYHVVKKLHKNNHILLDLKKKRDLAWLDIDPLFSQIAGKMTSPCSGLTADGIGEHVAIEVGSSGYALCDNILCKQANSVITAMEGSKLCDNTWEPAHCCWQLLLGKGSQSSQEYDLCCKNTEDLGVLLVAWTRSEEKRTSYAFPLSIIKCLMLQCQNQQIHSLAILFMDIDLAFKKSVLTPRSGQSWV